MSEEITKHEQIIRDLQAKIAKAEGRREKITAERAAVGYEAHVVGSKDARAKLAELNKEQVANQGDLESLSGALVEATNRLTAAKADAAKAADQERARKLREVLKVAGERSSKIDAALDRAVAELNGLFQDLNEIHSLGSEFPTHIQARQNVALAIKAQLTKLPNIWQGEFVTGGGLSYGRTLVGFTENMAATLERDIARRLGETQSTREAA
jgi:hypothetical protein